jgi:hypothetical protein
MLNDDAIEGRFYSGMWLFQFQNSNYTSSRLESGIPVSGGWFGSIKFALATLIASPHLQILGITKPLCRHPVHLVQRTCAVLIQEFLIEDDAQARTSDDPCLRWICLEVAIDLNS